MKLSQDKKACLQFREIEGVDVVAGNHGLVVERGKIADGGNSGQQAVNLAVNFGARRIVLVGFDLRLDRGMHWHGPHKRGLNNPSKVNIAKWRERLNALAPAFRARGIEVYRESELSTLLAYPVVTLSEALKRWA